MNTKYICPECRNVINIENNIVLIGKNKSGEKGIVVLHTHLGDYSTKFSSDFQISEGEIVKFLCPVCHSSLSNLKHDRLAQFNFIDEDGSEKVIVFSSIYGEKCTYIVNNKSVEKSFGEDFHKYIDEDWTRLI